MEEELAKQRFRNLSLKGKVIVVNSLVLSKAWYLATVISLPDDMLKKIERLIRSFLWRQQGMKYDPIERKTLYQPKDKGGLDIKNPQTQQKALQLNFFKNILDHTNLNSSLQLPRYWIGFDLATLNPLLRNFPCLGATATQNSKFSHYVKILDVFKTFDIPALPAPKFWTTRMFYGKLIEKDEHFPTAYTRYWNRPALGVNPETMWKQVHISYAHGKYQDIHYRFLHRILPTNFYMKNRFKSRGFKNMNPNCASCPNAQETQEHVFLECAKATPVMTYVTKSIDILLRRKPYNILDLLLNKFPNGTFLDIQRMVTGILQITMYTLWKNRNQKKFKKTDTHITESKNTILKHFRSAILQEYNKLLPDTPDKFVRKFCHTPEICKLLDNNSLEVNLIE